MDDSSASDKVSTGRVTPKVAVWKMLVKKMEDISERSAARSKKLDELLSVIMSTLQQQSQSNHMFTTPPARSNTASTRTVFDIQSVLNSNGKSTLEELEWASDYLSEKIEKVSLLIENLCKQIEHVSDKKDKKKIKNLEKTLRKTEQTRDTFMQQQGQVLNWISQNITGQTLASDSSSDSSDDEEETVGANVPPS